MPGKTKTLLTYLLPVGEVLEHDASGPSVASSKVSMTLHFHCAWIVDGLPECQSMWRPGSMNSSLSPNFRFTLLRWATLLAHAHWLQSLGTFLLILFLYCMRGLIVQLLYASSS